MDFLHAMTLLHFFLIYLAIGYIVSAYFIWLYRYKRAQPPSRFDSYGALFGPFVWPLQIAWHIYVTSVRKELKNIY